MSHKRTGCSPARCWNFEVLLKDRMLQSGTKPTEMNQISTGATGTDTLQFIHSSQLPAGKKATHVRVCADFRKHKKDPYRVQWTVRGDLVDYDGNTSTLTYDITNASILFNSSVILTEGARFIAVDVSNFYLESELEEKEYIWIPVHLLDAEFVPLKILTNSLLTDVCSLKSTRACTVFLKQDASCTTILCSTWTKTDTAHASERTASGATNHTQSRSRW